MNKKFLSAILFGALMVTSTGTFVSCKDYDDDIDQINKELTDIKSAIAALQAKVDGGKYVTNVVKNGNGITVTWNDNSTSTIETIKGDKGEDGKNGTIVTIVDGYWAFDGVKSEYPAKGDKGDKGDKGEAGEAGPAGPAGEAGAAAAAGHDAKISEDGYWMVWDAAKGEYVTTEFIAGGATAAQVKGGWNITVKDENGDEQTIFIPSSATMGYMDILNGGTMKALYGINAEDVEYGPALAKKTLKKGLYTTLDRDLQVVVNPQGTDASAYSYSLMNSANVDTELPFKEAVPFKGVLTRATSENAVWVLPHDFVRYENIDDARTKNYLLFKANDGARHALSLTATLNETTIKTPYNLSAQLKKIGAVTVYVSDLENCAVNVDYTPNVSYPSSVDAAAVYDYWITLEQSAKNLKNAQLYGVEIDSEGHSFKFTRETGVNNRIAFTYNYILMDGTVVEGDKDAPRFYATQREEMANAHTITLERLHTPMDAKVVLDKDKKYTNRYILTTQAYDLTELLSDMSDVEKVVWTSAIASGSYTLDLIGGEQDGEDWNTWWENASRKDIIVPVFDTEENTVAFNFYVSSDWSANFKLNKAYELTVSVNDEDTKTPVASIVLPFEFTQPTLDITRVNGEKAIWNDKKNVLSIYGDLVNENYMYVPFYEAFTTAYAEKYGKFGPNARYYVLSSDQEDRSYRGGEYLGKNYAELNAALTEIKFSEIASEWNTWAYSGDVNNVEIPVKANYSFYGVYPATKEQVSDFTLRFASLLGDAKEVKATETLVANNVTREVFLTDEKLSLVDALGHKFFAFDGVDEKGNIVKRHNLNHNAGFEEGTEAFATDFKVGDIVDVKAYKKSNNKATIGCIQGAWQTTIDLYENAETKTRRWVAKDADAEKVIITQYDALSAVSSKGFEAMPAGIMIQLPTSVGTTEVITVEFTLRDVFGVTKTLKVDVKANI